MIEYKIITTQEEKERYKDNYKEFFYNSYNKKLEEDMWKHQFINYPYNESPLFLALKDNLIVGSALMILHKCIIENKEYNYYLFTSSAVDKKYSSEGIYANLLNMQKEYAREQNVDFIFAFPNKIAYPVIKFFGGFKDLVKLKLIKTKFENLDLNNSYNSLKLDNGFFDWRFEHKDYKFFNKDGKTIILKEFENSYDILSIIEDEFLDKNLISVEDGADIFIASNFAKDASKGEKIDLLRATYYPLNKNINYSELNINLLMSDVF